MVLTVTLNPAVDKTYTTGELLTGYVNRMSSMTNIPGGKGINVSKILCDYGVPVTATGFLGGHTGAWIREKIAAMGIVCAFSEIQEDTRCSMNVVAKNGYVTEILEPGPRVSPEERLVFLNRFRELAAKSDLIVMSGSAARGLPSDIYAQLIDVAKDCGKKVLLDTSKETLTEGVKALPYLVKPNRQELEYAAGHACRTREEVTLAAQNLLRQGISYVAVSMGEKGMYLFSKKERLFARAPRIQAVNTVGCGDSAVASFAMSILAGDDAELMLKKAVALSAANATTMESGSIPQELAEQLEKTISVERF